MSDFPTHSNILLRDSDNLLSVIASYSHILFNKRLELDGLAKNIERAFAHAGLDPAHCIFSYFWIPASTEMTEKRFFAVASSLIDSQKDKKGVDDTHY